MLKKGLNPLLDHLPLSKSYERESMFHMEKNVHIASLRGRFFALILFSFLTLMFKLQCCIGIQYSCTVYCSNSQRASLLCFNRTRFEL